MKPRKPKSNVVRLVPRPALTMTGEQWPVTVRLQHGPVRFRYRVINALSFRRPTARDIARCGDPVRLNADCELVFQERQMCWMMAQLSGQPLAVIYQLDARDWNSCAYRLRGFFMPDVESWDPPWGGAA